jgi:hypothetical protein
LQSEKPVVRIDCGAESEFVDWNSFIWDSDHSYLGGQTLNSSANISQASPTLYDQAIDLRSPDITPDQNGNLTISLKAVGENNAILQGIEVL